MKDNLLTRVDLADRIESARYEVDALGRAVARAVVRGDAHAVRLHAAEFAAAETTLAQLRAERDQAAGERP